jgi:hypothetical protein
LVDLAKVNIDENITAMVIDDDVTACEDAFRIKVFIFWNNVGLPEQAVEPNKKAAP